MAHVWIIHKPMSCQSQKQSTSSKNVIDVHGIFQPKGWKYQQQWVLDIKQQEQSWAYGQPCGTA